MFVMSVRVLSKVFETFSLFLRVIFRSFPSIEFGSHSGKKLIKFHDVIKNENENENVFVRGFELV